MAAVLPVLVLALVGLAAAGIFVLMPPESGSPNALVVMAAAASMVSLPIFLASLRFPMDALSLLVKVKPLSAIFLRFYLPPSWKLGATLLAPVHLAIILWGAVTLMIYRHRILRFLSPLIPLTPFIFWQIFVVLTQPSLGGLVQMLKAQWLTLFLLLGLALSIKVSDFTKILTGLQIVIALAMLTVVSQWLTGWPAPVSELDLLNSSRFEGGVYRFGGIWGLRSKGAETWAEVSIIISFSRIILSRQWGRNAPKHIVNILYCIGIISLTGSRTPILVLPMALTICLLLSGRFSRAMAGGLIVLVLGAGILSFGLLNTSVERMEREQVRVAEAGDFGNLAGGRTGIWRAGIQNWWDSGPTAILLGGGWGTSAEMVNRGDSLVDNERDNGVHNQHLQILMELGVAGFLCYLLYWLQLILVLLKAPVRGDPSLVLARNVAAGLLTCLLLRGMTFPSLNIESYAWIIGLAIAVLMQSVHVDNDHATSR